MKRGVKQTLVSLFALFVLMFAIPFLAMGAKQTEKKDPSIAKTSSSSPSVSASQSAAEPSSQSAEDPGQASQQSFKILDETTGEIAVIPDEDFTYGAVATEMPLSFEPEALKAQAVAAYTYYSNARNQQRANPTPELKGADFSADPSNWKVYTTKSQMQSRWGDSFEENYQKLTEIVQPVLGELLESEGEPILAAFHAISGGTTEACADVFGGNKSYLVAVPSPGDLLAPDYQTSVRLSAEEFKTKAAAQWPELKLEGEPQTWVGEPQRTASGMVKTIKLGSQEVEGTDVRTAFGLRSADFDLLYSEEQFVFTVRGYGHGVGMSQYGAQYMAQQGSDYQQILAWYYPGTQLMKP